MCLAIPGRVLRIEGGTDPTILLATVDFDGIRKLVSLAFTPEAQPGDYVLVHVGFALAIISADEARKTLDFLAEAASPDEIQRELKGDGETES